ncbi:hypothetical protein GCM10010451_61940 [Streptomyces virens]|uniref:Uncharacterized protein n=1 Tax=Streptomyces virens TaxID=285572 RepID=A0ABP6Q487_9ACTN
MVPEGVRGTVLAGARTSCLGFVPGGAGTGCVGSYRVVPDGLRGTLLRWARIGRVGVVVPGGSGSGTTITCCRGGPLRSR